MRVVEQLRVLERRLSVHVRHVRVYPALQQEAYRLYVVPTHRLKTVTRQRSNVSRETLLRHYEDSEKRNVTPSRDVIRIVG